MVLNSTERHNDNKQKKGKENDELSLQDKTTKATQTRTHSQKNRNKIHKKMPQLWPSLDSMQNKTKKKMYLESALQMALVHP